VEDILGRHKAAKGQLATGLGLGQGLVRGSR